MDSFIKRQTFNSNSVKITKFLQSMTTCTLKIANRMREKEKIRNIYL